MKKIIWKNVVGFDGIYLVSNYGDVKSIDRFVKGCNGLKFQKGRILKATVGRIYLKVGLRKDGKYYNRQIHQLVAESFLGHVRCGHKKVVDHKDNNPLNNRLENLQIITSRKNVSKDKKKGTSKYIGVHWNKKHNKFISTIHIEGKRKCLGSFDDELLASNAYQKALSDYENFNIGITPKIKTSNYKGVCYVKRSNKWCATITRNGNKKQIGYFNTEIDAHNAYQNRLIILNKQNG